VDLQLEGFFEVALAFGASLAGHHHDDGRCVVAGWGTRRHAHKNLRQTVHGGHLKSKLEPVVNQLGTVKAEMKANN
jgi:hypothetical protein